MFVWLLRDMFDEKHFRFFFFSNRFDKLFHRLQPFLQHADLRLNPITPLTPTHPCSCLGGGRRDSCSRKNGEREVLELKSLANKADSGAHLKKKGYMRVLSESMATANKCKYFFPYIKICVVLVSCRSDGLWYYFSQQPHKKNASVCQCLGSYLAYSSQSCLLAYFNVAF